MTDIRRNWIVLGTIALLAIFVGVALTGRPLGQPAPNAPPTANTAAPAADAGTTQPEQITIRDYSEFGAGDEGGPSSDWLGLLAGLVVKLGFVLVLIFLAVKALRRYVYRGGMPEASKRPVSLLGTLNLAPNRSVYVLEVGRKVLVVGASQTQLSLLTEVTDPQAVEELRGRGDDSSTSAPFSAILGAAQRQGPEGAARSGNAAMMDTVHSKIQEGHDFLESKLAELRQARARS